MERILILLVDDDPVVRAITRKTLANAGFETMEAANGRLAMEALEQRAPALILLDVIMPEVDGYAFCTWLRENPNRKRIPVLMMTGLEDSESIQRAFEVGANDFIAKPVNPAILVQRVRFLLRASNVLEELARHREQLAEAQRIARLGSWELDLETMEITWSTEARNIFGFGQEQLATTWNELFSIIHPEDRPRIEKAFAEVRMTGGTLDFINRMLLPGGTEKWVSVRGELSPGRGDTRPHATGMVQDITERHRSEETIRYLSSHDPLTGLPNRLIFSEQLERSLASCRRNGRKAALLHLGLDRYKRINDSYGHTFGDKLLVQVATRLMTSLRREDLVARGTNDHGPDLARWGGDEFVVLLEDIRVAEDAARASHRLLTELSQPYIQDSREIALQASCGIVLYPGDGETGEELLRNADSAMHFCKESSPGEYAFYARSINEQAQVRLSLETELRKALERDELRAYFQPKVDMSGRMVGTELLLRWQHPEMGLLSPDRFIGLAEESGLIIPIGTWVIRAAARQLREWIAAGHLGLSIAVNISPPHFRDPNLLRVIQEAMAGIGPGQGMLELELTEGVLMEHRDSSERILHALKRTGTSLAIDDFGTGYSSLSYLSNFPIDVLKIDRSFITDVTTDPSQQNITRAIIALAHGLHLKVVAEGVETEEQAAFLRREQCDLIQGYLYGRPMPAADLGDMLRR